MILTSYSPNDSRLIIVSDYYKKGFSLVELMVVMAIVAMAMLFAMPQMGTWRANARIKAVARELYSDLQNAKMLAVKENNPVQIRFNNDDVVQHYYYFDSDGDGNYTVGEVKKDIWRDRDGRETGVFFQSLPGTSLISFFKRGTSSNGTIALNANRSRYGYNAVVNNSGRISLILVE